MNSELYTCTLYMYLGPISGLTIKGGGCTCCMFCDTVITVPCVHVVYEVIQ